MAIRRTAGAPVEVVPEYQARVLLEHGAISANGTTPAPIDDGIPHIDEFVEVHGLTDRDPEFFEKQGERIAHEAVAAALPMAPVDRMQRGHHRKGRR